MLGSRWDRVNRTWFLTVAPGRSYSAEPGLPAGTSLDMHIPLPRVEGSAQEPTPEAFGSPLQIEGYLSDRSNWLLAEKYTIPMGMNGSVRNNLIPTSRT